MIGLLCTMSWMLFGLGYGLYTILKRPHMAATCPFGPLTATVALAFLGPILLLPPKWP